MTKKRLTLVAVTQVIAVSILCTPTLAAVVHTTVYNNGLITGEWNGPNSATTTQNATVTTNQVSLDRDACWQAVSTQAFTFSYDDTITLPTLNAVFGGALADATFVASTLVHEDWHKAYVGALLGSTYGALETWSNAYVGALFETQAAALAAGNADLATALALALSSFQADYSTDTTNMAFGHQNAVAVIQNIAGTNTWRSENPNWGAAATTFAGNINVPFATSAGDVACIPEPSAVLMLACLMCGLAVPSRRRQPRVQMMMQ